MDACSRYRNLDVIDLPARVAWANDLHLDHEFYGGGEAVRTSVRSLEERMYTASTEARHCRCPEAASWSAPTAHRTASPGRAR
jgi:hypothetical protein